MCLKYCELPETPRKFDREKFEAGDPEQQILYKNSKTVYRKKKLKYADIIDEDKWPNYARVVPKGCMFIDYDNADEYAIMKKIILHSGLRCLILDSVHGGHFLFRTPDFYRVEMTKATNWFGMKFDCKATTDSKDAVQIMRVCGMDREERTSWDLELVVPEVIDIEKLDVLPYWLWGKRTDKDLFKGGDVGESDYTLSDTPFTQLMKMGEGGRHNHIVERCSHFGLSNGFTIQEFKDLIRAIHDEFLVKLGDPMPDSDLFGDLEKRWDEYDAGMRSVGGYDYDESARKWRKSKSKTKDKIDERRAAEWLYNQYDFYVQKPKADGIYTELLYREKDGNYEYKNNLPEIRGKLRDYSDQNFKKTFFEEVEVQLMQMCAEKEKFIKRTNQYVIAKNKVMSCILPDVYDFSWLGTRPPTDIVYNWTWQSQEWVDEHEEDLGGLIKNFIQEVARDSTGKVDEIVEQWLWVIAGAAMIPESRLEKIIVMAGGGANGKSIYTSLIRLCLGKDMFNLSKIFDTSPQDSFWGAGFDKGICCIVDDLPERYNKEAFSYIKGAITKTDVVVINEKFKPKRELKILPLIITCTNHEFKLYDKSEGMRRRVLILPTEYEIPVDSRDLDKQFELVLNTMDLKTINEYRMGNNRPINADGVKVKDMYTDEKGVLDSLDHGSLCWFANKARYMYFKWVFKEILLEESASMKERLDTTFKNNREIQCEDFVNWYLDYKCGTASSRDLSKGNDHFKNLFPVYKGKYCKEVEVQEILTEELFQYHCSRAIRNMGFFIDDKRDKKKGAYRYVYFDKKIESHKK